MAAYPGWRARMAAIPRFGQTPTGLIEEALVVASAVAIVRGAGQVGDRLRICAMDASADVAGRIERRLDALG